MEDNQIISLESEAGFRALFEYATVGILVIGNDGHIELANPCSEKLFGYSNAELIGKPVEILIPKALRRKHVHHRDQYFEKPKARAMGYGLNLSARRKDGVEFPVEISLGHYQLEDENLAVAFITDITQRKKAEEEVLERKRKLDDETTALEELSIAANRLWHIDNYEEGLQDMLSHSTKLFGTRMGNVQIYDEEKKALIIVVSKGFSKEFLDYFHEVPAEDGTVCAQALKNRHQVIVEDVEKDEGLAPHLHIMRTAGVKSVQSTPLFKKDGTPIGMISTHLEKTGPFDPLCVRMMEFYARKAESFIHRIRITEELKEINQSLEGRVNERTLELTQSLEREKELNELKSRFVSMASHEFRTPLTAILSSISLIEYYYNDEQKEKRDKHIFRVKYSVKNLVDILDDFLSLDKLEQGKVEILKETFNLHDFTMDIVEDMNGILKQGQKLNFSHRGEKVIVQDKKILKNVFYNLLSNAIKYSEENKEIHLLIEVCNDIVSIKVSDDGIGIPAEEQKYLFNKFYRAKNVTNIQGTGLGLNIVKKYVELLNGTISFISELNKGTVFTIEFPRNKN